MCRDVLRAKLESRKSVARTRNGHGAGSTRIETKEMFSKSVAVLEKTPRGGERRGRGSTVIMESREGVSVENN